MRRELWSDLKTLYVSARTSVYRVRVQRFSGTAEIEAILSIYLRGTGTMNGVRVAGHSRTIKIRGTSAKDFTATASVVSRPRLPNTSPGLSCLAPGRRALEKPGAWLQVILMNN